MLAKRPHRLRIFFTRRRTVKTQQMTKHILAGVIAVGLTFFCASSNAQAKEKKMNDALTINGDGALMKSVAGDSVVLQAPVGTEYLTVLEVCYERISVEPFREPPGSEDLGKGTPSPTLIHLTKKRGNGTGGERATTVIEHCRLLQATGGNS
jgi:hypothetical protein